jgi:hypothetical protein
MIGNGSEKTRNNQQFATAPTANLPFTSSFIWAPS